MIREVALQFRLRRTLPIVRVSSKGDSILACMEMIAAHHRRPVSMRSLRQKIPVSLAGVDVSMASRIMLGCGFSSRIVEGDRTSLAHIKLPALVQFEPGHFAVLARVNGSQAILHDPMHGHVATEIGDLGEATLFEVVPNATVEGLAKKRAASLVALWSKAYGLVPAFLQVAGLTAIFQILAFVAPLQMQLVIDQAIMESDEDLLLVICLAFGFIGLMQGAVEALRNWTLQVISQSLVFQSMRNVVFHMVRLPIPFFASRHVGDITSRLQSSRQMLDILTQGLIATVFDGLTALIAVVILFVYSTQLALITLVALVLVLAFNIAIFPPIRRKMDEEMSERAAENSLLIEMIRASTTIKLMGREVERLSVWSARLAAAVNAAIDSQRLVIGSNFVRIGLLVLQTTIVVYFGGLMVIRGENFSVGMLVAFLSYRQTFADRAQSLVHQIRQFQIVGLHMERLSEIISEEPDALEQGSFDARGKIELSNISFSYGAFDRPVLTNINLTIEAGEYLAITGPSGGGKTTLIKLILGLYPVSQGEILLDGVAPDTSQWRAWREHVGVVTQDDQLLSGTIGDNICFFDPEADFHRIREAAKLASIDGDIMRMSLQYATLVGDMGSALSGGQRQRILLARALYREPRILILDEGTANLDLAKELSIGEVVRHLKITRIIVAHRPALIEMADRIVTMSEGQIIKSERGLAATASFQPESRLPDIAASPNLDGQQDQGA